MIKGAHEEIQSIDDQGHFLLILAPKPLRRFERNYNTDGRTKNPQ